VDLAKYRAIFIEESAEHFADMGAALLELEKNPTSAESIDVVFRMAHSIKGMAGSLGYDAITRVAHRLEDRMQVVRSAGRVPPGGELSLLFRGLSALEAMVEVVKETGESPPADEELLASLSAPLQQPATADPAAPAPGGPARPATPDAAGAKKKTPATGAELMHPAVDAPRPPPSVRVHTAVLDRFLSTVGEVILNASQVRTAAEAPVPVAGASLSEGLDRMDRVVGELQRSALELRTTPLLRIVEPLPRTAREIAQRAGKRVEVEIAGAELELDRSILDRLSDPLVHLLRNAVDHGVEGPEARVGSGKPEVGRIRIEARREKDTIRISVSDDGAGIDLDAVRTRAVESGVLLADLAEDLPPDEVAALIFHPGLSTSTSVSEISGRGVGMDAVRATIEGLGGAVEVASERGRGTVTTLVVPITAAVQRVLLVGMGSETVALPIAKIERVVELPAARIERSGGDAFVLLGEDLVPVLDLGRRIAVGAAERAEDAQASLLITEVRGERVALTAERVLGQQQIYVKPVPQLLSGARALAGLTILGDGRPMFLLDLNQLA
jgi:two-component system, chemotaxis family, sensor kinase CheA